MDDESPYDAGTDATGTRDAGGASRWFNKLWASREVKSPRSSSATRCLMQRSRVTPSEAPNATSLIVPSHPGLAKSIMRRKPFQKTLDGVDLYVIDEDQGIATELLQESYINSPMSANPGGPNSRSRKHLPSFDDDDSISRHLDDFEIVGEIGRGQFGIVLEVKEKWPNGQERRRLAWKDVKYGQMAASEITQLHQEARLCESLRHPHVVRTYGRITDGGRRSIIMVMELMGGGDLGTLIRNGPMQERWIPESLVLVWTWQLLSAVKYCHDGVDGIGPVLHRDIKPHNVLLSTDCRQVKLADFGLAKMLHSRGAMARSTVGTPYYMSPEVLDRKGYDHRSDLWGLGCLLYELVTGRSPFAQAATQDHLKLLIHSRHPLPSIRKSGGPYSEDLNGLIQSMLTKDATARPSATQLLETVVVRLGAALDMRRYCRVLMDENTRLRKLLYGGNGHNANSGLLQGSSIAKTLDHYEDDQLVIDTGMGSRLRRYHQDPTTANTIGVSSPRTRPSYACDSDKQVTPYRRMRPTVCDSEVRKTHMKGFAMSPSISTLCNSKQNSPAPKLDRVDIEPSRFPGLERDKENFLKPQLSPATYKWEFGGYRNPTLDIGDPVQGDSDLVPVQKILKDPISDNSSTAGKSAPTVPTSWNAPRQKWRHSRVEEGRNDTRRVGRRSRSTIERSRFAVNRDSDANRVLTSHGHRNEDCTPAGTSDRTYTAPYDGGRASTAEPSRSLHATAIDGSAGRQQSPAPRWNWSAARTPSLVGGSACHSQFGLRGSRSANRETDKNDSAAPRLRSAFEENFRTPPQTQQLGVELEVTTQESVTRTARSEFWLG